MRIIDADALKKDFSLNFGGVSHAVAAAEIIDRQPTVEAILHTREQVEKCFGGVWEFDDEDFDYDWHCGKCECPTNVRPNFCPRCGSAMTDEAVEIVMKRLEALYGEL